VFSRFPRLRVVLLEGGVTWLPPFLWRFDKEWRSLRSEVPWVDRPPSAIIREHVRMTTTPTDVPPHSGQMRRIVEQIGADHMLLFSTDYPHWQFDDADGPLPAGLPPALLPRIALNNARATYPGLQETPP